MTADLGRHPRTLLSELTNCPVSLQSIVIEVMIVTQGQKKRVFGDKTPSAVETKKGIGPDDGAVQRIAWRGVKQCPLVATKVLSST